MLQAVVVNRCKGDKTPRKFLCSKIKRYSEDPRRMRSRTLLHSLYRLWSSSRTAALCHASHDRTH